MKKAHFKAIVDNLRRKKRGFMKMIPNPAGTKFRRACDQNDKRRGANGVMR